jgi:hypothetical protein
MMNKDLGLGAALALFCSFGGVLGYISRSIYAGERITTGRCIVAGLSAGYVCVLTLLLTSLLGWDMRLGAFISGVLAWMGAEYAMSIYTKVVKARLGQ